MGARTLASPHITGGHDIFSVAGGHGILSGCSVTGGLGVSVGWWGCAGGLGVSVRWWGCEVVGGGRGGVRMRLRGVGLNVEASALTGGVSIEGPGPVTTPGCGLCVCGEGECDWVRCDWVRVSHSMLYYQKPYYL